MDRRPENMDLSVIATETMNLLRAQAHEKNIRLSTSIAMNTWAYADENMARTIFRNLVSNAIKFTHTGGEVRIGSECVAEEPIPVVVVSVKDNGIGISGENLNKLFRMDEPVTTPGTAREKGTGLGLQLCKEFVEKNGGRIWAESEPGKGSTFVFTLPVEQSKF
ncbi:MAG: HAMP domain-containing sensor histidine kinase [bacterium]